MTEAIIWGVIWLLATIGGAWLLYVLLTFAGVALAAVTEKIWVAPIFIALGALAAVCWFIFGAVRTVEQIISIVGFATGG